MIDIIMDLFTIKPSEINPDSVGAKKWVWRDNGEIKISARLFARFGPVIALALFFSLIGTVDFIRGPHSILNTLGVIYVVLFVFGTAGLISFNRLVRRVNAKNLAAQVAIEETNKNNEELQPALEENKSEQENE